MGQSASAIREREHGALDLVITNAVILDHWGIVKADVGIKNGRIVKVGKAGNPDTMERRRSRARRRRLDRSDRRRKSDPHGRRRGLATSTSSHRSKFTKRFRTASPR